MQVASNSSQYRFQEPGSDGRQSFKEAFGRNNYMKCLNTRNFRVYATRSLKLPLVDDLQKVDMVKPKVIITVKINHNRFPKVPDFDRTKNYHNKEFFFFFFF